MLGLASRSAGRYLRAGSGGAYSGDVEARAREHADRVDLSRMASQARCFGIGQEQRSVTLDWVTGARYTDETIRRKEGKKK